MEYIPWIISGASLLIAFLTYTRNGNKDSRTELDGIKESILKANMKLDQVCATTNETRTDIKTLNRDLKSIETRVSVVEESLKTAFMRIDEIKEKVGM